MKNNNKKRIIFIYALYIIEQTERGGVVLYITYIILKDTGGIFIFFGKI